MNPYTWLRVLVIPLFLILLLCCSPIGHAQAASETVSSGTYDQQQSTGALDPLQLQSSGTTIEKESWNQTSKHIDTSQVDKYWKELHSKYGGGISQPRQGDDFLSLFSGPPRP